MHVIVYCCLVIMSCTAWVCLHDTSMGIKVHVNVMICAHLNRVRTVQLALRTQCSMSASVLKALVGMNVTDTYSVQIIHVVMQLTVKIL